MSAAEEEARGIKRHVEFSSAIPDKWQDFFQINTNYFHFLAVSTAANVKNNKQITF